MLWLIYILVGLAVVLLLYGCSRIQLLRIEDEYDRYRETAFDLFNRIRPAVEILAAYNSKLKLEKYEEKVKQKLIKSGNLLQLIPMEFLAIKEI
jgi:type II secretory pathway component PulL